MKRKTCSKKSLPTYFFIEFIEVFNISCKGISKLLFLLDLRDKIINFLI